MTCIECKKKLSYAEHRSAMDHYGIELCERHKARMDKLHKNNCTPIEAIQLYYGLKQEGANPMLEWWDGKKSVDLAFSRVKLNIEIDTDYHMMSHEQAINNLTNMMHSFQDGFTTIRIPHTLIKYFLNETVENIIGIKEGLRARSRVI